VWKDDARSTALASWREMRLVMVLASRLVLAD
jgi:hypothetical protein